MQMAEKETLYPGSHQIPAMRYHNKLADSKVDAAMTNGEWAAQEKKDGCFYQLEKIDNDHIYLFSRTKSKKTGELAEKGGNVPHIIEWARNYLPDDTVLLGEIYIPDGHSNDVTSVMGCLPKNAIARQEASDWVHYYVFDCIYYNGIDLCDKPFETRVGHYLEYQLYDIFHGEKYIELAPTYTLGYNINIGIGCNSFQEKLNEIFVNGGEGVVFKRLDGVYEPDKRPMTCFKMKEHVDSVDLIVMDLLDPTCEYCGSELDTWPYWWDCEYDKFYEWTFDPNNPTAAQYSFDDIPSIIPVTKPFFYGWKNAIQVGAYKDGKIVEVGRVASGLTDELREEFGNNPDNYIGKVVELSCMSLNKKDHTIRHPVFECFREDKDKNDCLLDEIFS